MDRSQPQRTSFKTQYLIAYNLTSALLWSAVLGRVLLLIPSVGYANVYSGVGEFAKWTQTLALLEVVHSAFSTCRPPTLYYSPSTSSIYRPNSKESITNAPLLVRDRPLPDPHHSHASRLTPAPRLGHCEHLFPDDRALAFLQQYAGRVVDLGSRALQLLRDEPARGGAGVSNVAAV